MVKKNKEKWIFLPLILFSLVPLVWFLGKGSALINGLDTNFPLDPVIWFFRRFFVWNDVANAGANFSSSTAGIFFHLVQLIPYLLTNNLQLTQIISLVFWFSLLIFSSYLFARTIIPDSKIGQIVFVSLYVFNVYIFNTWENVKVANLAVVTALPLLLTIFISYKNNEIRKSGLIMWTAFVGVISLGAGINPAYFLVIVGGLSIMALVEGKLKILLMMLSIIFLVNSFWIVSTGKHLLFSEVKVSNLNDIGFTNWLDSLSENTSILNVFRLQGAWDWYAKDSAGAPLYIPYANNYFYRLPFVVFSIALPIFAFLGLQTKETTKSKIKIYLGILLILGIFLGAGSHPPTGAIYKILNNRLPFFSFFRSPWYIFTPYVTLAISGMAAIWFSQKNKIINVLAVIIVIGNLIYVYPLITGKIFRPDSSDSFYVKIPEYVFGAKEWLDNEGDGGRIVGYPGDEIERFEWGYSGIESFVNLFSSKETIFLSLNAADTPVSKVIRELYESMRRGEFGVAKSIATKLNIGLIFEKSDQSSLWGLLSSDFRVLGSKSFGPWTFYNFTDDKPTSKIYFPQGLFFGTPPDKMEESIGFLSDREILVSPYDTVVKNLKGREKFIGEIILSNNSQLEDYKKYTNAIIKQSESFTTRNVNQVTYTIELTESGMYQPALENFILDEFGLEWERGIRVFVDGVEDIWIANEAGGVLYFDPIKLSAGRHSVLIPLKNKNLVVSGEGKQVIEIRGATEKYLSYFIKPFVSLHPYLVEFNYKNTYGRSPLFKIEQKSDTVNYKFQTEGPPFSPEEIRFSFYFDPVPATESFVEIKPSALSSADDPLGTKLEYSDLAIYPVFTNKLLFIKRPIENLRLPGEINFKKITPSHYKGEVRKSAGSHLIVFSENYSPDWKIVLKNVGGEPLTYTPAHFSVNLYANAWYIEDIKGDYEFEIYYEPQKLHNFFLGISLATIILAVGYYLWDKVKK